MSPALALPAQAARVDGPMATLVVEGGGPLGCPNAGELARRVDRKLGAGAVSVDPASNAPTRASLLFYGFGEVRHARVVTTGLRPGRRELSDSGTTCAGLEEAVALTLALVFDPAAPYELSEPQTERPPETSLELGPFLSQRQLPGLGAGMALGLETLLGRDWAARLAAEYWFESRRHFGTASVMVGLIAGDARVCRRHAFGAGRSPGLSVCLLVEAGALSGEATGFRWNRHATRPWATAGLGIRLGGDILGPIAWGLWADAATPLADESFSLDGLGQVYRPSVVGFSEGFYIGVRLF